MDAKTAGEKGFASISGSVFNLTNVILGAGILSLPSAFEISGLLLGLFFLIFIYGLNLISVWFFSEAMELSGGNCAHFRDLANFAFGKVGLIFTDIAMILTCFGALCSYLIIIADMITSLIAYWGDTEVDEVSRAIILIITAVLVMPLSSLRYLNPLRFGSLVALIAVFYIVFAVVYRSAESIVAHGWKCNDHGCVKYANFEITFLRAVSIMCFAFTCHMNIPSIFYELKDPTRIRTVGTGVWSISLAAIAYALVAVFGYLTFFGEVEGNILLNYPLDDTLFIVARVALAVVLFFSYPLVAHPLISSLDGLCFPKRSYQWIRRMIFSIVVCFAALCVAIFVKDVSLVFGLTGSTGSTIFAFLFPSLFILYLHPGKLTNPKKILAIALFVFGFLFLVISTTMMIMDEVSQSDQNSTDPHSWPNHH